MFQFASPLLQFTHVFATPRLGKVLDTMLAQQQTTIVQTTLSHTTTLVSFTWSSSTTFNKIIRYPTNPLPVQMTKQLRLKCVQRDSSLLLPYQSRHPSKSISYNMLVMTTTNLVVTTTVVVLETLSQSTSVAFEITTIESQSVDLVSIPSISISN